MAVITPNQFLLQNTLLNIACVVFSWVVLMVLAPVATAQQGNKEFLPPDSIIVGYTFTPGTSVTYRVLSYDSIVIFDIEPRIIIRERVEHVMFRCDSIMPEGYAMSMFMTDYAATERLDTLPEMAYTGHPWVRRPVRFLMSRMGKRIRLVSMIDIPGVAPGAPFQPLLLPYMGEDKGTYIGASKTYDIEHWLVDNVYPPALWHGAILRLLPRRLDSLGYDDLYDFAVTEVGQVYYSPPPAPGQDTSETETRAVVNGGGHYYFSDSLGYPVAGEYQLVANLTFTDKNSGQALEGRHVISMEYRVLEEGVDE